IPAVRSLLDVCDEVVVNVGRSDDGTRELVAALGDPRVRILDTVWDFSRGSTALAVETDRAMAACRGAWGLYVQADEVLDERGAAARCAAAEARGVARHLHRGAGPDCGARGAGPARLDSAVAPLHGRAPAGRG